MELYVYMSVNNICIYFFIPKELALNIIDSILSREGRWDSSQGILSDLYLRICTKDGTHGSHGKMGINNYEKRVYDLYRQHLGAALVHDVRSEQCHHLGARLS